jgi:hypothetical protein
MRTPVFATRPEDLPAAARIAAMSGLDIMRARGRRIGQGAGREAAWRDGHAHCALV